MRAVLPRKPILTTSEVARAFGVNRRTIARWTDDGYFEAATTMGGHRRFDYEDVRKVLEGMGRQVVDKAS